MRNSTQPITADIAQLIQDVGDPVIVHTYTGSTWTEREYDPRRNNGQNPLDGNRIGRQTVATLRKVVA